MGKKQKRIKKQKKDGKTKKGWKKNKKKDGNKTKKGWGKRMEDKKMPRMDKDEMKDIQYKHTRVSWGEQEET